MPRHVLTLLLLLFTAPLGATVVAQDYKGHKYRGTIDSVSDTEIVIREPDAETLEFLIRPQVKIMRDNHPASIDDLQRDDLAFITAERDGNLLVALTIFVMAPE